MLSVSSGLWSDYFALNLLQRTSFSYLIDSLENCCSLLHCYYFEPNLVLLFRAKSRVNEVRCTSKFDHLAKLKYTVGKLFVLYFSNFKSQLLLVLFSFFQLLAKKLAEDRVKLIQFQMSIVLIVSNRYLRD